VDPGHRGRGWLRGGGPSRLDGGGGRGGGPGSRRRQGPQYTLSREEQEQVKVDLQLAPSGEDKGARGGLPDDGQHH
jgi:hypothetical protein